MNYWYKVVIASGVGGAYVSLLGANKDAPFESFEPIKLSRSFIVAIMFGILFSQFTNDWIILGYTAIGAERALVESYKKFVLRKKPGKFK